MNVCAPCYAEREKASNSYLVSLLVGVVGLPFPILNLLAMFFFYYAHRSDTYFVRWHCMQAMFSQLGQFLINNALWWWTVAIFIGPLAFTSTYVAFLLTVLIYNIVDLIATAATASNVRKGASPRWYVYGVLTDMFCKP